MGKLVMSQKLYKESCAKLEKEDIFLNYGALIQRMQEQKMPCFKYNYELEE